MEGTGEAGSRVGPSPGGTGISKERTGQLLQAVLRVITEHGEAMTSSHALDLASSRLQLSDYELSRNNSGQVRWENNVGWYSVDAVRAGWLVKNNGQWSLTPQGVDALNLTPSDFMSKAHEAYLAWQKSQAKGKPTGTVSIEEIEQLRDVLTGREGVVWWVNQGDDYVKERDGGYVWAPKESKAGIPLAHYTSVSRLRPGDVIIHYANTGLRAVSRVLESGHEGDRPESDKDKDGFLSRTTYHEFAHPIPLDFIPLALRAAADAGPFTQQGAVKQGYLFQLSDPFVSGLLDQLGLPMAGDRPSALAGFLTAGDLSPLVLDQSVVEGVIAALDSGHHLIITGPPGTGKTHLAELVAKAAARYRFTLGHIMTTASADWTTFDTLGGYMPDPESPSRLRFERGVILDAIASDKWVVLDEINRADADKAFGALLTLLAGFDTELPFQGPGGTRYKLHRIGEARSYFDAATNTFHVGTNWRVVATMNTRDKNSLYALSYAFMRRFSFIYVGVPEPGALADIVGAAVANPAALSLALAIAKACPVELGPAVIIDIARSLATHSSREAGIKNSVIAYVLPQLEGRDSQTVRSDIRRLRVALGISKDIERAWLAVGGVFVGADSQPEPPPPADEMPIDLQG